ncbi:MAG TPA: phage baseplate assembly protein [Rhodopila sp.]|jgi:phage baseplate assembly protein V|nr:phage baseplate assembly protein [Rhodopila sp.]
MKAVINRLLGMFGVSRTTAAANEAGGIQTLQVQILGSGVIAELREPVPSAQHFGFASSPVPGASHVIVFLGGDRTKGIAIASNDPRYRPTGMKPGESMQYDDQGRQIYLSASSIVVNAKGAPVTVNDATTVTINASTEVIMNTPILKVSGDIQDNFETNQHTMAQMRTLYDEHDHQVADVQAGSSIITTSTPSPQE